VNIWITVAWSITQASKCWQIPPKLMMAESVACVLQSQQVSKSCIIYCLPPANHIACQRHWCSSQSHPYIVTHVPNHFDNPTIHFSRRQITATWSLTCRCLLPAVRSSASRHCDTWTCHNHCQHPIWLFYFRRGGLSWWLKSKSYFDHQTRSWDWLIDLLIGWLICFLNYWLIFKWLI
jgi:hypothetical protein